MNKECKTFLPVGCMHDIHKLVDTLETMRNDITDEGLKNTLGTIIEEKNKELKTYKQNYEEILKYISQFYGKYVHMKFYYNINYTATREETPIWQCDNDVNALLYCYVPSNHCLFGVFNQLNDEYCGGVKDSSINLFDLTEEHLFEIEEITEEDFVSQTNETVLNCLKKRLDKIESGDYVLTDNGYERKKIDCNFEFANWAT